MASQKLYGLFIGTVFEAMDNDKSHRIRAWIPGIAEPSAWARPLGLPGAGGPQRGMVWPLKHGAEVGVFFEQGDPTNPRYLPGGYGDPDGVSELPEAAQEGYPDVSVFQWDTMQLEVDERPESAGAVLKSIGGTELLRLDAVTGQVELYGITMARLVAMGAVEIEGVVVTINGRVVRPGSDPI